MVVHRRRNDVVREAGTFPKLCPSSQIIAPHAFGGADNHLGLALVFDYEGSGPGGLFIASNFPERFAGVFVKGVNEGVTLLIPANDERVAVEHGRTAFAMGVERIHSAKIFLPYQLAFQIQAIEATGTEEGVEPFTIRQRRIRSEAAGLVTALVRPLFPQHFQPGDTPIATADRKRKKLVAMSDRHAVVNPRGIVIDRLLRVAHRPC